MRHRVAVVLPAALTLAMVAGTVPSAAFGARGQVPARSNVTVKLVPPRGDATC
jgi:hypothetical protein